MPIGLPNLVITFAVWQAAGGASRVGFRAVAVGASTGGYATGSCARSNSCNCCNLRYLQHAMAGILRLCCLATALSCAVIQPAWSARSPALQHWISRAEQGLYLPAQQTLTQIPDDERRLLALRAYLRAGDALAARWSWSAERIAGYPDSTEGRAAMAELDAVAAAFARDNPGYQLRVNRQPRSLELQLQRWNANASVAATAHALAASLRQRWGERTPDAAALRQSLTQWVPPRAAALAAPGLSAHGQARAFDFQIAHAGRIIAADDYASAHQRWDLGGWTRRLHLAVSQAGPHLSGPLAIPYEPWHYAYHGG